MREVLRVEGQRKFGCAVSGLHSKKIISIFHIIY